VVGEADDEDSQLGWLRREEAVPFFDGLGIFGGIFSGEWIEPPVAECVRFVAGASAYHDRIVICREKVQVDIVLVRQAETSTRGIEGGLEGIDVVCRDELGKVAIVGELGLVGGR
jgi:hypothetical protein